MAERFDEPPAMAGLGTGFGAKENVWKRELTEDGRVYFFNRATGTSQWHLPNDLYVSSRDSTNDSQKAPEMTVVFPTLAKPMLCVDCVTESATGSF
mmetsp:Transcript_7324/g.20031  ORF Transcript_7324/g.20031 Transcript_7324/m.20031 type:complete len:96 (+) Transcript_7324:76-363(+)